MVTLTRSFKRKSSTTAHIISVEPFYVAPSKGLFLSPAVALGKFSEHPYRAEVEGDSWTKHHCIIRFINFFFVRKGGGGKVCGLMGPDAEEAATRSKFQIPFTTIRVTVARAQAYSSTRHTNTTNGGLWNRYRSRSADFHPQNSVIKICNNYYAKLIVMQNWRSQWALQKKHFCTCMNGSHTQKQHAWCVKRSGHRQQEVGPGVSRRIDVVPRETVGKKH